MEAITALVLIAESWGAVAFDIAKEAFKQWQQENASKTFIVVTGNKKNPRTGITEAEFYANQLEQMGLPKDRVVYEAQASQNTRGQAEQTRKLLNYWGLSDRQARIVIYTHDLHAPRVAALFQNSGIKPQVVAVRYQADRSAPLSVFWMRFGRRGYSVFEKHIAARRDLRNAWITPEEFQMIKRDRMPEGITLEIVG